MPPPSIPNPFADDPASQTDRAREARLASLAQLANGVAHDLNNIMTPLLMAVQLLRKDPPPEQRNELLDTARAGVARGVALVQRLQTISGTTVGELLPLRVEAVIEEVRSALNKIAPSGVHYEAQIANGLWSVAGDAAQLTDALRHIGENARDAVAKGGTVTFSAANATLDSAELTDQSGAKPGRYVVLSVADNGSGIAAEIRDRIFDPFFTTKPFGQGVGLGLALARGVVRGHGGFIRVASKVGEGSRFSIYLPAAEASAPAATRSVRKPPRGNGETVLIIDDERAIARLARLSLESHGYTAITALSGTEGVELFSRNRDTVRVIVLDLMMPDMDGPATLKALRAVDPAVRILATSGRPSTVAGEVQGFLSKPYDAESLVIGVHDILAGFPPT